MWENETAERNRRNDTIKIIFSYVTNTVYICDDDHIKNIHVFLVSSGVTTNSATATNCVSLYDFRGIH